MPRGLTGFDTEPETLPAVYDIAGARRGQRLRRAGMAAMLVVVLAGAVGLLGVHSSTTTDSRGGYTASFTYARVARAGWDVPWRVQVSHPGGFDGSVTLAVNADAFQIFETQRFWPEPSSETRGEHTIYLTFDPPPGDTLVVEYDAYIQPSAQRGRDTNLTVITGDQPRLVLHASTFLLP